MDAAESTVRHEDDEIAGSMLPDDGRNDVVERGGFPSPTDRGP